MTLAQLRLYKSTQFQDEGFELGGGEIFGAGGFGDAECLKHAIEAFGLDVEFPDQVVSQLFAAL